MTKPDFEFSEMQAAYAGSQNTAKLISEEAFSKGKSATTIFVEGARYQHSIDLAKHESIIKGLKFELESTKKVYQMNREYVESVKNKIATLKEVNKELVNAVNGLCSGEDWNNGTHAKIYRPKVIDAIEQIKIKLGHI